MAYIQKNNPIPKTGCGRRRIERMSNPFKKKPCWDNYEMIGTKRKNGKTVPNCVPSNSSMKKADPRRTIGRGKNFNPVSKDKSATGGAAGGGMTQKGVDEYKRNNPDSNLQMAVTDDPSKLKPGSKKAKRRKSFCARSRGWTGERGKAARRRWNC